MRLKRAALLVGVCFVLTTPARALDPTTLDPIVMAGNLQFFRKTSTVQLSCGQIASFRPSYLESGTLVFQLMAATTSTATPKTAQFKMAEVQIGKIVGHTYWENVTRTAPFKSPTPGTYYILFVLAEWDGFKYVPIDWYMFSNPKVFSSTRRFQYSVERIPGT
jgi:hypothetical protein